MKSHRDEGHWKKILETKPTWVLIQFGHNDQSSKGPKRETDAKTKDPSKPDKTHLSAKGAEETAKLIAAKIRKNAPDLAKDLK